MPYGLSSKIIPKSIYQDKERLYQDSLQQKEIINKLSNENTQLKTKILTLDREKKKYENMFDPQNAQQIQQNQKKSNKNEKPQSEFLVINMKRTIKSLEQELKAKNNELINLKKTTKFSRISELQTEVKEYVSETQRLREMLNQAFKWEMNEVDATASMEAKFQQHVSTMSTLKQDNIEMAQIIKELEEQLARCTKMNDEHEKQKEKWMRERDFLKKDLIKKEKSITELLQLEKKIKTSGSTQSIQSHEVNQEVAELKAQMMQKMNEYQIEIKNAQGMQKNTSETEKLLSDCQMQQKHTQQELQKVMKERNDLNYQYHASLKECSEFKQKIQNLEDLLVTQQQEYLQSGYKEVAETIKVDQVKFEEIEQTIQQLRQNLQVNQCGINDVEQLLKNRANENGIICLGELENIFSWQPFEISGGEKVDRIARYIIEMNQEDDCQVEKTTSLQYSKIMIILKSLLGEYRIMSRNKEYTIGKGVITRMEQKSNEMMITLEKMKQKNHVNANNIATIIEANEEELEWVKIWLKKQGVKFEAIRKDEVGKLFERNKFESVYQEFIQVEEQVVEQVVEQVEEQVEQVQDKKSVGEQQLEESLNESKVQKESSNIPETEVEKDMFTQHEKKIENLDKSQHEEDLKKNQETISQEQPMNEVVEDLNKYQETMQKFPVNEIGESKEFTEFADNEDKQLEDFNNHNDVKLEESEVFREEDLNNNNQLEIEQQQDSNEDAILEQKNKKNEQKLSEGNQKNSVEKSLYESNDQQIADSKTLNEEIQNAEEKKEGIKEGSLIQKQPECEKNHIIDLEDQIQQNFYEDQGESIENLDNNEEYKFKQLETEQQEEEGEEEEYQEEIFDQDEADNVKDNKSIEEINESVQEEFIEQEIEEYENTQNELN